MVGDEGDDGEVRCDPRVTDVHREVDRRGEWQVDGVKFAKLPNHGSVLKSCSRIFPGGWLRLKIFFGYSHVEIEGGARERRRGGIDAHFERTVVFLGGRNGREKKASFGVRRGGEDLLAGVGRAIADKLDTAIDDHLRRVDATARKGVGVVVLALGQIARRVGVAPAEMIPVVDVFLEGEDFDVFEGLVLAEFLEEQVGGRTTRAAFGSKEFDDNGLFLGCSVGGPGGKGPAGGDRQDRGNNGN